MILVTGATGNLRSSVVAQLLKLSSTDKLCVTSSSPEGMARLEAKGLQARLVNFSDPTSLTTAFKGIHKLLLISTMDQHRFQQHKNVIDAGKAQGVQHIIDTSLAIKDIQSSGVKDLMMSHFQTEDYIKASGLSYTILRNTMYADTLTQILGAQCYKPGYSFTRRRWKSTLCFAKRNGRRYNKNKPNFKSRWECRN